MISRWRVGVLAAVLAWPVAAAAGPERYDDRRPVVEGPRQVKTFSVGAGGSLKLGNVAGDITVIGGSGSEIRLESVVYGKGKTETEARAQIDTVTIDMRQTGNRVDIETRHKSNSHAWVDYTVAVPAGTSVDLRTVSGDLRVRNVTGAARAETVSGDVSADGLTQVVELRSVSGDVVGKLLASDGNVILVSVSGEIAIKGLKAKTVSMESVSGDTRVELCECGGAQASSVSGDVVYIGPLASSGRYSFTSHSGDVILTTSSGFELTGGSFSGDVSVEGLTRQGDSDRRGRTWRGTVGGGGAIVEVKTFSGDFRAARPK